MNAAAFPFPCSLGFSWSPKNIKCDRTETHRTLDAHAHSSLILGRGSLVLRVRGLSCWFIARLAPLFVRIAMGMRVNAFCLVRLVFERRHLLLEKDSLLAFGGG